MDAGLAVTNDGLDLSAEEVNGYLLKSTGYIGELTVDSVSDLSNGNVYVLQTRSVDSTANDLDVEMMVVSDDEMHEPDHKSGKPTFDKRKRIPCREFAKGIDKCKLGRECPYRHATKNVPCHHFVIGNCNKGTACNFRHSTKDDVPCKHFVQGKCNNGDKCQYRHSTKDDVPCKFFIAGKCSHGNKCQYRHSTHDIPCKFFVAGDCKKDKECDYRHSKKDVPCKFYTEGKCMKGDTCEYQHKK